jgi:hypothetical protein
MSGDDKRAIDLDCFFAALVLVMGKGTFAFAVA